MAHDDDAALRDRLIEYVQDAYTMENEIIEMLDRQIKTSVMFPSIQARIQQHRDASIQHRQRMEDRLTAYGKKPSAMKGFWGSVLGNVIATVGTTRRDSPAITVRDDYVAEHFEIVSYGMLIATAQALGDGETVHAAEANLYDEVEMADWLERHMAEATMFSLQVDNIELEPGEIEAAVARVRSVIDSARAAIPPPAGMGQAQQQPPAQPTM